MSADNEDIFLNDVWTLYFHNPDDNSWDESSCHRYFIFRNPFS